MPSVGTENHSGSEEVSDCNLHKEKTTLAAKRRGLFDAGPFLSYSAALMRARLYIQNRCVQPYERRIMIWSLLIVALFVPLDPVNGGKVSCSVLSGKSATADYGLSDEAAAGIKDRQGNAQTGSIQVLDCSCPSDNVSMI